MSIRPPRPPAVRGIRAAAGDLAAVHRDHHPDQTATGLMTPVTAAALICAALLSVLIYPVIALGLLRVTSSPAAGTPIADNDASRAKSRMSE